MATSFKDKIVIVTGGSNGIGAAIVSLFLEQGAKVASFDVVESVGTPLHTRLDLKVDVASEDSVNAAVQQVVEKWHTIDVLVNCAGVMDNFARITETSNAMFQRCMTINLNGPFNTMKAVIPHFLSKKTDSRKGTIINICSLAAVRGCTAGAAYTTSKHALLGLSRSTSFMYKRDKISCNVVLPGAINTNIMGNSRSVPDPIGLEVIGPILGTLTNPADPIVIAKAVSYLAGADGVNGAEIIVDGGWNL